MGVSYPRTDILTLVGFSPPFSFDLQQRQELSTLAGGKTIGKDMGPPLWVATYTTEELRNDDAVDYQAVINSLDGVTRLFEAFDLRRASPRAYPGGVGANDGVLRTVNANNKWLSLSGLAAGQIISRGDYLSFTYGTNRALHQAMELVAANGSGTTPEFEVRPLVRSGFSLSAAVSLKAPRGLFSLVPGSVQPKQTRDKFGQVSFSAGQYIE